MSVLPAKAIVLDAETMGAATSARPNTGKKAASVSPAKKGAWSATSIKRSVSHARTCTDMIQLRRSVCLALKTASIVTPQESASNAN